MRGWEVQLKLLFILFIGKILNDDQPLSEYHIDEKGFVVVMVTKVNRYLSVQFDIQSRKSNHFGPRTEMLFFLMD